LLKETLHDILEYVRLRLTLSFFSLLEFFIKLDEVGLADWALEFAFIVFDSCLSLNLFIAVVAKERLNWFHLIIIIIV